jgi:hypothetical protein
MCLSRLAQSAERQTKVFIEVEDIGGDIDVAYGLLDRVSVFNDMMMVLFGEDSISLCRAEDWWFQTEKALLIIDPETCLRFKASFEEPAISAHMAERGLRFMKTHPHRAGRWCRRNN